MGRQITLEYKHFEELQDAYEREQLLIKTILKLALMNTSAKKALNVYDSHTNLITVYADY